MKIWGGAAIAVWSVVLTTIFWARILGDEQKAHEERARYVWLTKCQREGELVREVARLRLELAIASVRS